MRRARIALLTFTFFLLGSSLPAQSNVQGEVVMTVAASQEVTLPRFAELTPPAIRVGNEIYIGFSRPAGVGGTAGPSCHRFYFLNAEDPIPDDVVGFVSVVVGVGSTRGYVWRGPFLYAGSCGVGAPK